MNPKIGIVTVLYNSETVLEEFFATLDLQTYKNFVLYVIDNKSSDNSLNLSKLLASTYTFQTIIVENNDNYGVAKGNNIGIHEALKHDCDMVLLANNDITIKPNTIETLLSGMKEQNSDMAVPKILFHGTNLIWAAGGYIKKSSGYFGHIGVLKENDGHYDEVKQVYHATTCFMLIDKRVFDQIGFIDEKYFVYWDDTDFVYRAMKKNILLHYIPDSLVHHKAGTSTGRFSNFSVYYFYRNLIYFARKNYSPLYFFYIITYNLIEYFIKRTIKWKITLWKVGIKGIFDGFKIPLK